MSLTPGWLPEDDILKCARKFPDFPKFPELIMRDGFYYIDNESEYKSFPRTKSGWEELCEALKDFNP